MALGAIAVLPEPPAGGTPRPGPPPPGTSGPVAGGASVPTSTSRARTPASWSRSRRYWYSAPLVSSVPTRTTVFSVMAHSRPPEIFQLLSFGPLIILTDSREDVMLRDRF